MNGSGNLEILCATSVESLELRVGDGGYDGPGDYAFAPNLNRGEMYFKTAEKYYDARAGNDVATACTVHVTGAPVSDFPPVGSEIVGTFDCKSVPRFAIGTDGKKQGDSDGSFDVSGAFHVAIR